MKIRHEMKILPCSGPKSFENIKQEAPTQPSIKKLAFGKIIFKCKHCDSQCKSNFSIILHLENKHSIERKDSEQHFERILDGDKILAPVPARARTSLIRDSLWFAFDSKSNQPMIRKWVNHDSPSCDFWFDLILIRRCIMICGWIAIRDDQNQNESKWIKSIWIANQNELWIKMNQYQNQIE